jgi:hypothetical protein
MGATWSRLQAGGQTLRKGAPGGSKLHAAHGVRGGSAAGLTGGGPSPQRSPNEVRRWLAMILEVGAHLGLSRGLSPRGSSPASPGRSYLPDPDRNPTCLMSRWFGSFGSITGLIW